MSRVFKDREHTAHSRCRTACYAVQGHYGKAESWLRRADKLVGDLARPSYIRGLIDGARGDLAGAEARFKESLRGRAKRVTQSRIAEAAEAAGQLQLLQGPAEYGS